MSTFSSQRQWSDGEGGELDVANSSIEELVRISVWEDLNEAGQSTERSRNCAFYLTPERAREVAAELLEAAEWAAGKIGSR